MIATPETHARHRVIDANGLEWDYVYWVDTESGQLKRFVPDASGKFVVGEDWNVVSETITVAAPVLLVPM